MAEVNVVGSTIRGTLINELDWVCEWALQLSDRLEVLRSGLQLIAESRPAHLLSFNGGLSGDDNLDIDQDEHGAYTDTVRRNATLVALGSIADGLLQKISTSHCTLDNDVWMRVRRQIAEIYQQTKGFAPIPVDTRWMTHKADGDLGRPRGALAAGRFVIVPFVNGTFPRSYRDAFEAISAKIQENKNISESEEFFLCFADEEFFQDKCRSKWFGKQESQGTPKSIIEQLQERYPKMRVVVQESKWVEKTPDQLKPQVNEDEVPAVN